MAEKLFLSTFFEECSTGRCRAKAWLGAASATASPLASVGSGRSHQAPAAAMVLRSPKHLRQKELDRHLRKHKQGRNIAEKNKYHRPPSTSLASCLF